MMTKIIKYTLCALSVLLVALLVFSPSFRREVPIMVSATADHAVGVLEKQLDQGSLALRRFDEEYVKAEQKLVSLRHLRLDAQRGMQRAKETAAQYRSQGKDELARRNEEQAAFYEKQAADYEISIQKRSEKLQELKRIRELAREDVRLARERIVMLQATRDAMDSDGQEEMLQKAQENIESLHSHCNRLNAELEVIKLTD